jgi:hypothetical protein
LADEQLVIRKKKGKGKVKSVATETWMVAGEHVGLGTSCGTIVGNQFDLNFLFDMVVCPKLPAGTDACIDHALI